MIDRYTKPEMAAIWSEQRKAAIMLEVELLACEGMEALGTVPAGTAAACREGAAPMLPERFPLERIDELDKTLKHDVIAFLTGVGEVIGEPARHLHKGMTSSDVLDTTLAVQLKQSGELILATLDTVLEVIERRSREHATTLCMGRSHGIHAEPTTFGLKLAILWDELRRSRVRIERAVNEVAVGQISGAVGTFAHLDPSVEAHVMQHLGLTPAPASNQVVQRDRHAHYFHCLALLATSVEKIAVEIRHLQRTEVLEAQEAFSKGQKGSSAMPHKKNPILSENLTGQARLARGYANMAMDNVALWHERDISHSSVERVAGPDANICVHFMLVRLRGLMDGLIVYPQTMLQNMEKTGGLFYAQRVMLGLVESGLSREESYALVQRNAMRGWEEGRQLLDLLKADDDVSARLSDEELDGLADPSWYVRRAGYILDRVFAAKDQSR
ncbi:MAG: adenylosuccinate lyase [Myxococcota bacterium]|nr:adenylosuccinate lyase [Myxococcota bacterium]